MQKAMECSSKSSATCSGDCEWKQDENKCDLNGAVAMQAMTGGTDSNNPMASLMQKAMQCSSKSSAACTGDCEWKQGENKCDLNAAVALQSMTAGDTCAGRTKSACEACESALSAAPSVLLSFP